jgi:hypothetical protein
MIPGGDSAQVRVLVSDGFHTTVARSQTFALPDRRPLPTILTPVDGMSRPQGREVIFEAQVFDPEDGFLGDTIEWRSDIDGLIGTGSPVAADNLSVGQHQITLTATDSAGNSVEVVAHLLITPTNLPAPKVQEVVVSIFSGEITLMAVGDESGLAVISDVPQSVWLGLGGLVLLMSGLVIGVRIGRRSRTMPGSRN